MIRETSIADYVRLARVNPTVEREFEVFKEDIFNKILIWEDKIKHTPSSNIIGINYDAKKRVFKDFDNFKNISYEEAAAIAYIKYYRAINAFILPTESRIKYLDLAYTLGPLEAIKKMQTCAGVKDDGIIGPVTREKMQFVTEDCLNTFITITSIVSTKKKGFFSKYFN